MKKYLKFTLLFEKKLLLIFPPINVEIKILVDIMYPLYVVQRASSKDLNLSSNI